MEKYILAVLAMWNLAVLILYGYDKQLAISKKRRISERVLIGSAMLLGGLGAFCGMLVFHHKTRKMKFIILVPLSLILLVAVSMGLILRAGFSV